MFVSNPCIRFACVVVLYAYNVGMIVFINMFLRQGCTRVQYPIWQRGNVDIPVNVIHIVDAWLAVRFAINVIRCPFSNQTYAILYCLLHKHLFANICEILVKLCVFDYSVYTKCSKK